MTYPLYPADPNRDPAEPFRNLDPVTRTGSVTIVEPRPGAWDQTAVPRPLTTEEVVERQREQFGGLKVGSAFFGWLTAAATAAILTGLLAVGGALLGLGVIPDPWKAGGVGPLEADTVGWIGVGLLLAILLLAYYCGGYVAGRMARFSGIAQGVAVWVWTIVVAIVVAIVGVVLSGRYDFPAIAANLSPSIPLSDDVLMIAGIIVAVAVAVASLGGALLGGTVGVRYHRRVDRVGFES